MILCMDIGNTQMHGGVFEDDNLLFQFRKTSGNNFSSDEIGIFLKNVLRENNIDPSLVSDISVCSVVPDVLHSFRNGCLKYFAIEPLVLKPGVKTGLKIRYRNPLEVGTDRIANSIAATNLYPNKNLVIVDFGTATTFDVVNKNKEYLGGVILPGIRISMEALSKNTAQLPNVEIFKQERIVGKSTEESIRSGLFHGQKAMIKELTKKISNEAFEDKTSVIIATGGFSSLFESENLFDIIVPDLVLIGLHHVIKMNRK